MKPNDGNWVTQLSKLQDQGHFKHWTGKSDFSATPSNHSAVIAVFVSSNCRDVISGEFKNICWHVQATVILGTFETILYVYVLLSLLSETWAKHYRSFQMENVARIEKISFWMFIWSLIYRKMNVYLRIFSAFSVPCISKHQRDICWVHKPILIEFLVIRSWLSVRD